MMRTSTNSANKRSYMKTIIKRLLLLVSIIILWKIASLHINQLFIPKPEKVFNDFIITIRDGSLFRATVYSLRRIAISTLLPMSRSRRFSSFRRCFLNLVRRLGWITSSSGDNPRKYLKDIS